MSKYSRIEFRVTESEKQYLAVSAKEYNLSISDYIRHVLFEKNSNSGKAVVGTLTQEAVYRKLLFMMANSYNLINTMADSSLSKEERKKSDVNEYKSLMAWGLIEKK